MKTYTCACGQQIFFQNVNCVSCGRELGFLPDALCLSSLESAGDQLYRGTAPTSTTQSQDRAPEQLYRKCQNYAKESVCNWMIPDDGSTKGDLESFCASCRLNETIPDLSLPQNHQLWANMEIAKRRLLYSLISLKLPIATKKDDPRGGLAFAFLGDVKKSDGTIVKVLTGHEDGLITLNIAEADDAVREKIRVTMKEPIRTLLGHFRHEIGHYYWDRLVQGTDFLPRYRDLFGDERADYVAALKTYYANGAPVNWPEKYISAYATAHPWEDWAECWAHFMHIQDALETANDFGLVGKSIHKDPGESDRKTRLSAGPKSAEEMVGAWSELSVALNSINRSMGLQDTYPFVLSPHIVQKLSFIFEVISSGALKTVAAS